MKLEFWREQKEKKAAVAFKLTARVQFNEEEAGWLSRFDQRGKWVNVKMDVVTAKDPKGTSFVSVEALMDGVSVESENFLEVLEVEVRIREFCKEFRALLSAMATFRGYEAVEVDISRPVEPTE